MTETTEIFDPTIVWPLPEEALFVLAGTEQCTCDQPDGRYYGDHDEDCWLQESSLFKEFWAIWNKDAWMLFFTLSAKTILRGFDIFSEGVVELHQTYAEEMEEESGIDQVIDAWRDSDSGEGGWDDWDGDTGAIIAKVLGQGNKMASTVKTPTLIMCSHDQTPVTLPNGITVYASSSYGKGERQIPDFAVYLDGIWQPECIAYHIGCPDRSIPYLEVEDVLKIGREVMDRAREGQLVEIGCIGAHGRTGLFLGVLVNLAWQEMGVDWAKGIGANTDLDGVMWVRQHYCTKAIESIKQEWYVDGIGCELAGVEWPVMPTPPPPPCYSYSPVASATAEARVQCDLVSGHEGDHIVYAEDGKTELKRWERVKYVPATHAPSGVLPGAYQGILHPLPTSSGTGPPAPAPDWDE